MYYHVFHVKIHLFVILNSDQDPDRDLDPDPDPQ
jgi:hypothetical protein